MSLYDPPSIEVKKRGRGFAPTAPPSILVGDTTYTPLRPYTLVYVDVFFAKVIRVWPLKALRLPLSYDVHVRSVAVLQRLSGTGWRLNLESAHQPGLKGGANSKTKVTCPACGQNAWGKPDLYIDCKFCGRQMTPKVPV